jgi:hypothetical protein
MINTNELTSKSLSVAREIREENYLQRPTVEIAESTIEWLVHAGVDPRVARVNLELVKEVVQAEEVWSPAQAELAELEYKRMLTLILWNPTLPHPIVPTRLVDKIWHRHILDSRAYHADMQALFGEYLHHFPYLGFRSEESLRLKLEAFELSCRLYEKTFGESFPNPTFVRILS